MNYKKFKHKLNKFALANTCEELIINSKVGI